MARRILRTSTADVPNWFYLILSPAALAAYFVFPRVRTEHLLAALKALGLPLPDVDPQRRPFIYVRVLIMGWNWAPFFAQLLLKEMLEKADNDFHPMSRVADQAQSPSFTDWPAISAI